MVGRWILRLLLSGAALYATSLILNLLPHDVSSMTMGKEIPLDALAVFCLSLVNSLVRPVLKFLTMPLTFATLGLSGLVINGVLFWVVGHYTGGYEVKGVAAIFLGPIILGILNGIANFLVADRSSDKD